MLRQDVDWGLKEAGCHGGGVGKIQACEKTSIAKISYPSVVRFTGHVQLKGVQPGTLEAFAMMFRLLTT